MRFREKKAKKPSKIGVIIEYIIAMALSVVFALYANALTGWFILIALILLPVFSFLYTRLYGRFIDAEILPFPNIVGKGDMLDIRIKLKNKGFLPSLPVEITLCSSLTLEIQGNKRNIVYLMPKSEYILDVSYKAVVWGEATAGIESVSLAGFLGFVSKQLDGMSIICDVGIIPDIAQLESDAPVIRSLREISTYGEEVEQTRQASTSATGMPGNEHREYIEGDSLRRINWKISARLDKFMVRLSDETLSSGFLVTLDARYLTDNESMTSVVRGATAVEGFLGVLELICRLGLDCKAMVKIKNSWQSFDVERLEDIMPLRHELARFSFKGNGERLPMQAISENKSVIIITPCYDRELDMFCGEFAQGEITPVVIASESKVNKEGIWLINESFDITDSQGVSR